MYNSNNHIIFSCENNENLDDLIKIVEGKELEATISNAKIIYNITSKDIINLHAAAKTDSCDMLIKPDRESVFMQKHGNYKALEIGMLSEYGFSYVLPECESKSFESGNERYKASCTRLVYFVNEDTDDIQMFLMTIVPRVSYIEYTNFKPFQHMSYLERDKNFSGLIFYHDTDGTFANGWNYYKGEVVSEMNFVPYTAETLSRSDCVSTVAFLVTICNTWVVTSKGFDDSFYGSICYGVMETGVAYSTCGSDNIYYGTSFNDNGGYISQAPQINDIYSLDTTLKSEEKAKLNKALKDLCTNKPIYQVLFNKLKNCNVSIKFEIDANKFKGNLGYALALYDAIKKTIYFKSSNDIIEKYFQEEFVHCIQDNVYQEKMNSNYKNTEFEAKLVQDVICRLSNTICGEIISMGADATYSSKYSDYLNNIEGQIGTVGWNCKLEREYKTLGNEWNGDSHPFDKNIEPKMLIDLFN